MAMKNYMVAVQTITYRRKYNGGGGGGGGATQYFSWENRVKAW